MTVTITRPQRRRPVFLALEVAEVERLTDTSVAVAFAVPEELRSTFAFRAGQHLTVRRFGEHEEVRRSYSICSAPHDLAERGLLRVGIKSIRGGAFSSFAVGELRPGHTVDVLPPLGHFTTAFDPARTRHYAAVVAGSGITPVLSLLTTALRTEPASRFTLLYGNRTATSVMFAEELADLKDRHPARLHVVHVLSREPQDAELLSGRLDADRLRRLLKALLPADSVDEWFLCGPHQMVLDAKLVLDESGVADTAVHTELFHVEERPAERRAEEAGPAEGAEVTVLLDGRASILAVPPGERILDAARRARPELPYACKGGVFSTCMA